MKSTIVSLTLLVCASCSETVVVATFTNRNVYKTKSNLKANKAYLVDRPATDIRDFTITPNDFPSITKTENTTTITQSTVEKPTERTTKVVISTIPESNTTSTETTDLNVQPAGNSIETKTTSYSIPAQLSTNNFIRYQVVVDEGDFKYIRILPGCQFDPELDTSIIFGSSDQSGEQPQDFIFRVSKKDLVPNTHYLASSALIGKITTVPVRVRNEYWNNDNKTIQGTLAISYSFGWKYKLGNNPYRPHYLTTILYGAGISQQKYFYITGTDENDKAILSDKSDEFAVTYVSFGFAYEFDKFNIGIFAGRDRMFGTLENWVYQDKWWWGLGIGYDLFK